jgi:hypothetical protein
MKSERNRRLFERWWIVATILWEVLRTLVVGQTFSKYGVNPYLYFAVCIVIAIPYAKSVVRLIAATIFREWGKFVAWLPLVLLLHFIPDFFIIFTADAIPDYLMDTFLFIVLVFFVLGIRGFLLQVKSGRVRSPEAES